MTKSNWYLCDLLFYRRQEQHALEPNTPIESAAISSELSTQWLADGSLLQSHDEELISCRD